MRYLLILLLMLFGSMTTALAQLSVGIGLPGVSIGINLPMYPELVRVPGYPVYYAPRLNSNFFFYDGMYWVFQGENWYASSWYNGPWGLVGPEYVPVYILRIPVRYYRAPPSDFRGWRPDAPPRWGERWGHEWEQKRPGWDKWSRNAAPAPAPLPIYQRKYPEARYPKGEQQRNLQDRNYRYQPRDAVVRQHYQEQAAPKALEPAQRVPRAATQAPQEQRQQPQPMPKPQALPKQGRDKDRDNEREKSDDRGQDRDQGRGQDRNK